MSPAVDPAPNTSRGGEDTETGVIEGDIIVGDPGGSLDRDSASTRMTRGDDARLPVVAKSNAVTSLREDSVSNRGRHSGSDLSTVEKVDADIDTRHRRDLGKLDAGGAPDEDNIPCLDRITSKARDRSQSLLREGTAEERPDRVAVLDMVNGIEVRGEPVQ